MDDVIFIGLTVMTRAEALDTMELKPGALYRETMVRNDESTLRSLIAEKGHPHVKVGGESALSVDRSKATLTYRIEEGPSCGWKAFTTREISEPAKRCWIVNGRSPPETLSIRANSVKAKETFATWGSLTQ